MQITLLQAVIIGLWTAFCYSGMLWGIFTNRALALGSVLYVDLKTALQCGAIAELAFMGFGVGAGGTVPPNIGIIGKSLWMVLHQKVHYHYLFLLQSQFNSYKQLSNSAGAGIGLQNSVYL